MHAFAALLAAPLAAAPTATLEQLSWLAGHWRSAADGRVVEELWMPPAGGTMLGLNRSVSAAGARFEFLRIVEEDGTLAYLASPQGAAPTRFALDALGEDWVRFANPAHDFPTQIGYRHEGGTVLHACVGDGTRESCWRWERAGDVAGGVPE